MSSSALEIVNVQRIGLTQTFEVRLQGAAIDSLYLDWRFDPAQVQAVQWSGPANWALLANTDGQGNWTLGGYSSNFSLLPAGSKLLTVTVTLNDIPPNGLTVQYGGTLNDTVAVPSHAQTLVPMVVNQPPTGALSIMGTPMQGQTLTAQSTLADLDGMGPLNLQWRANGLPIEGATGSTLVLGQAQVGQAITVSGWYVDGLGRQASRTSAATAAVADVNDPVQGTVTIGGTLRQGQTLTAQVALSDADGLGDLRYQWLVNDAPLAGATGAQLLLTPALAGQRVAVQVQYVDLQGHSESVRSATTGAIANVNDATQGQVLIQGTASRLQTLTALAQLSDADGLGSLSYQWQANGVDIAGATGSTLTLAQAQVGQAIRVRVRHVDGWGQAEEVLSAATAPVSLNNQAPTGSVTLQGSAVQGQTLSVQSTLADADGLGALQWVWKAGDAVIAGASGTSLVLTQAQVGQRIRVMAQYTDGAGTQESVLSVASEVVANVNDAPQLVGSVGDVLLYDENSLYWPLPVFEDADGDAVQVSVTGAGGAALPGWLQLDTQAGALRVAAGQGQLGQWPLQVLASDGQAQTQVPLQLVVSLTPREAQGAVQDGYVAGARIYVDRNGNGLAEPEEDSGLVTDSQGNFTGQVLGRGALMAVGGTNIDTGLRNLMPLRAPEGSSVINPVTTLVQALVDEGLETGQALTRLAQGLGLPAQLDLLSFDPLAQGAPVESALAVQKASAQLAVTSTLAGDTGVVMQVLAQTLAQQSEPQALDLGSAQVVQSVVQALGGVSEEARATLQTAISEGNLALQSQSSLDGLSSSQKQTVLANVAQDLSAPVLQSATPAGESTGVALDATLRLVFDEALQVVGGAGIVL
ncbi:MAG: hypothetical protein RIQ97_2283, partial [Pseudomonadota bacterium]